MRCFRSFTMSLAMLMIFVLASCGNTTVSPQGQSSQQATNQGTSPATQSTATIQVHLTPQSTNLQHIFYIMMENHAVNQIIGNTADAPYLNQLASTYGTTTHYYGVTHPSLPNYLSAIAGNFQGIWDDCHAGAAVTCPPAEFASSLSQNQYNSASSQPHLFNGQTIVDQLEAHQMTWQAYMQSLPTPGFTGASAGPYAEKHNPFMYFSSIRNNPARMQHIVPFTQFDQDIQSANMPNFVWITPDVCNDMHGGSSCPSSNGLIAQGDNFVHTTVQKIMGSPVWQQGAAIIISWDESDADQSGCCQSPTGTNGSILGGGNVPLIVVTSQGPRHITLNDASYNHYSLLATIEHLWNLGCIANTCSISSSDLMTKLFT